MTIALIAALLLDAVFGEPRWLWDRLPHPAVLMGRAVGALDQRMNFAPYQRIKGALGFAALVVAAGLLGWAIAALPGQLIDVVIAAVLLAQRSLTEHVGAVADGLRLSLEQGRRAVSMIVSRDTKSLDTSGVARSAIESGAENMSDGVIAPAFWFLIGGLPGLMIYKVTNTADSMIGYRTPRHEAFGWAAARFDDLLNIVPARLTALLIWATRPGSGHWADIRRDARLHKSPNAGWPEAALSRVIGVALAGPRSYDGTVQDFPFVNPDGRRTLGADDIDAANRTLWRSWALFVALLVLLALI